MDDKKKLLIAIAKMDYEIAVADKRATKMSFVTYLIGIEALIISITSFYNDIQYRMVVLSFGIIILGLSKLIIDPFIRKIDKEIIERRGNLTNLINTELTIAKKK
jgi:non-canonical (house-cleaning) NTP pyrophosphatase